MNKAINLEEKANEFVKQVVPENASDIQLSETKKAFIAGMIYGYKLAVDLPMTNDNEEEVMGLLFNYNTQLDSLEEKIVNGDI